MTIRRPSFWRATAGVRWKRCFWTSRAAAALKARRRNERAGRGVLAPARRRDDAALLVPAALVVAAAARSDLLAHRGDADLGLPAILHRQQCRFFRARRRHLYRRRVAMGHPVPRPAWLLHVISGGDVVAQPRQPDDESAAAV